MYMRLTPSFSIALAALLALAANLAHSQDSGIIGLGIPETVRAGSPLDLPNEATSNGLFMTILWDIKDSGGTGATLSGNTFRATDTGTATLTATFIDTINSDVPVKQFSASAVHTAAIKEDGTLWTWGDNWVGQLGLGTWDAYYKEPIRIITTPDLTWATVSAGGYWEAHYANYWDPYNHYYYTIALTTDGALWAWGDNRDGQLGIGDDQPQVTTHPLPIPGDNDWAAISAHTHTVALKTNGTLWAWGDNRDGQLGDGTTTSQNKPKQIISEGSNDWATVTAGFSCTLAIKTNGTLWAWGNNWAGQLGDGSKTNCRSPQKIGTDTDWLAVAPGFAHTIALKANGTLYAWGNNSSGAFGNNTRLDSDVPLQIGGDEDWVAIAAGGNGDFDGGDTGNGICNYTVALKADGTLWAWGDNTYYQLGDGTTDSHIEPNQVGTDTNWATISTTSVFVMASKTDGSLWAWGHNYEGQLGDGTTAPSPIPGQVNKFFGIETLFTQDFPLRVIPAGTVLIIR